MLIACIGINVSNSLQMAGGQGENKYQQPAPKQNMSL